MYSNVSKGVLAKSRDLKKVFGMDEDDDDEKIDHEKICLEVCNNLYLLHSNVSIIICKPYIISKYLSCK